MLWKVLYYTLFSIQVFAQSLPASSPLLTEQDWQKWIHAASHDAPECYPSTYDSHLKTLVYLKSIEYSLQDQKKPLPPEIYSEDSSCRKQQSLMVAITSVLSYDSSEKTQTLLKTLLAQKSLLPFEDSHLLKIRQSTQDEILGAYDCLHTKIYFSPHLAPLDLRGVLLHEIEHLVQDKAVDESPISKMNSPENMLLQDEAISTLRGIFSQAELILKNTVLEKQNPQERNGLIHFSKNQAFFSFQSSPYLQSNHLNFIQPNGNLSKYMVSKLDENPFQKINFKDLLQDLSLPKYQNLFQDWKKMVSEVYFPETNQNLQFIDSKKAKELFQEYDPIASFEFQTPSKKCLSFNKKARISLRDYLGNRIFESTEGFLPGSSVIKLSRATRFCTRKVNRL